MTSANLKLCEKAWEVRREKRSKLVQLFKNLTTSNKDVMLGLQHVVALDNSLQYIAVAPPRGVRGLKFPAAGRISSRSGRTPSWGAWIEIHIQRKYHVPTRSHPLVGCVD